MKNSWHWWMTAGCPNPEIEIQTSQNNPRTVNTTVSFCLYFIDQWKVVSRYCIKGQF